MLIVCKFERFNEAGRKFPPSLPPLLVVAFFGALFFALRQDFFITTGGCRGLKSSGMLSL
jgi:hypothetical protein